MVYQNQSSVLQEATSVQRDLRKFQASLQRPQVRGEGEKGEDIKAEEEQKRKLAEAEKKLAALQRKQKVRTNSFLLSYLPSPPLPPFFFRDLPSLFCRKLKELFSSEKKVKRGNIRGYRASQYSLFTSVNVSAHCLHTIQDIRVGGWDRAATEPPGSTQAEAEEGDREEDQIGGEKAGIVCRRFV